MARLRHALVFLVCCAGLASAQLITAESRWIARPVFAELAAMFTKPFTTSQDTVPEDTLNTLTETDTHVAQKIAPAVATWWSSPVVTTKLGSLRGVLKGGVHAYLGVPYSEQPVRFGRPVTKKPWSGTYDATYHRGACPEFVRLTSQLATAKFFNNVTGKYNLPDNFLYSEDCLKMAVYAPVHATPQSKLPVMVWFHGGGNMWGTARVYNGTDLAKKHGVIVVSVEYRLGAMGQFASSELQREHPDGSTGGMNYLMDQQEALRFTRAHIQAFGGDPAKVTIFGESAGGIAVCNHIATPLSKGLYDRAVIQSGPCTGPWEPLTKSDGLLLGKSCMDAVGCKDLACMRKKHWLDIFQKMECGLIYISIDGHVLDKRPWNYYEEGKVSLPKGGQLLTGFNKGDTLFGSPWWSSGKDWLFNMTSHYFESDMKTYFPMFSQLVLGLYPLNSSEFGGTSIVGRQYLSVNADVCVRCPVLDVATRLEEMGHHVYVYDFQYNPSDGPFLHNFAGHAVEVPFVFGSPGQGGGALSPFNESLSHVMTTYWANFAKHGVPTAEHQPVWHRFRHQNNGAGQFLRFGPHLDMHHGAVTIPMQVNSEHYDRCILWSATGSGLIKDIDADKFCFQQGNITKFTVIGAITQPKHKGQPVKNPHAFHEVYGEHRDMWKTYRKWWKAHAKEQEKAEWFHDWESQEAEDYDFDFDPIDWKW